MPRQINYQEVARNIARYMVAHPNRVCAKTFCEALSKWLNNAESKKLLDYYINVEKVVQPVTEKHYRFTCHQEHFNPDAVRDIFLKYDIQSHFGKAKKTEVLIVKASAPVKREPVVEETPIKEPSHALTIDEQIAQKQKELDALYHQKAVADAKKSLAVILEFAGMSVDKLVDLIKLANEWRIKATLWSN